MKLEWFWSHPYDPRIGWYDDDADFANAEEVRIPGNGTKTVDVTVN